MIRKMNFSKNVCDVHLLIDESNYKIKTDSIIVNLSNNPMTVGNFTINKCESAILINDEIKNIEKALIITDYNKNDGNFIDYAQYIKQDWDYAYDIFKTESLKNTPLYRSSQEKVDDKTSVNFWYCPSNTDCGIHNEHSFKEIHVQIFGYGKMQVFNNNNYESLKSEVILAPGSSHKPFYDNSLKYPYHQYQSISDCIWLVIEES